MFYSLDDNYPAIGGTIVELIDDVTIGQGSCDAVAYLVILMSQCLDDALCCHTQDGCWYQDWSHGSAVLQGLTGNESYDGAVAL